MRVRSLSAVTVAALLTLAGGLVSGCGGGSSQSVISTGFPAGTGTNSLTSQSAARTGSLTLTAQNLPSPIFFPAPTGVPDAAVGSPKSATGGSLTLVRDTAYQTKAGVQFPKSIALKITFPQPTGLDSQSLNVYYFDGTVWQPVSPTGAGFSAAPGVLQTTITSFQGTGLYAVMSSVPPAMP